MIVAQRVSTVTAADEIIVLDEGKVVGQGTHDELVENNETYQEIVESQLKKEMSTSARTWDKRSDESES